MTIKVEVEMSAESGDLAAYLAALSETDSKEMLKAALAIGLRSIEVIYELNEE